MGTKALLLVTGALGVIATAEAATSLKEDCVDFNPDTVKVANINGRWKVVDSNKWLFDFGTTTCARRRRLAGPVGRFSA